MQPYESVFTQGNSLDNENPTCYTLVILRRMKDALACHPTRYGRTNYFLDLDYGGDSLKIINSVCTSLVFPQSRKSLRDFRRMAEFLGGKGIDCIEFYHDGDGRDRIGPILADAGLDAIYIAVIPSKEGKLHLCDCNEGGRQSAVRLFQSCIDEAQANGIGRVMMNSGAMQTDTRKGLDALGRSVEELFGYAARKNYRGFALTLEPCDTGMEAFQLIGPYARAKAFAQAMREKGLPLELTMDSAHTAEEGEDFFQAVEATREFCGHLHFANCNITQPDNPLYGDKHLGYEYPHTVWTPETLGQLTRQLQALYPGEEPLRIGLEFLCREDDPYSYFERTWDSLPFLHKA